MVKQTKRNRRPKRKHIKDNSNILKVFSCNSAGLKNKLFSLSKIINDLSLSVFCLQETDLLKEGLIKFQNDQNYQIFEKLRETKSGGGLAIGAVNSLNPIWLGDGGSDVEAISIQISVQGMNIRVSNAYGPQEYDNVQKKINFWTHMDNEFLHLKEKEMDSFQLWTATHGQDQMS